MVIRIAVNSPYILVAFGYNNRVIVALTYRQVQLQIYGVAIACRLDGIQQSLRSYRQVGVRLSVEDHRLAVANSLAGALLFRHYLVNYDTVNLIATVSTTGLERLVRTGFAYRLTVPSIRFTRAERVLLLGYQVLGISSQVKFIYLDALTFAEQGIQLMRSGCQASHQRVRRYTVTTDHYPIKRLTIADSCIGYIRHNGIHVEGQNLLFARTVGIGWCYMDLVFTL